MTFQRSPSGFSSLYLFYRVDAIVFVEGGTSAPTLSELIGAAGTDAAHDVKFWAQLFRKFSPHLKLKFRAVGSKRTLQELASLISHGSVTGVVVCMDRDLDHLLGTLIEHPMVAYTHGYSWENDAWCLASTIGTFRRLGTTTESEQALAEIVAAFNAFRRALTWPLLSHALLTTNGFLEVTTSDMEKSVVRGAGKMPIIDCAPFRHAVKSACPRPHPRPIRFPSVRRFSIFDDCYGHLLATFAYHTVAYALRKHSNIRHLSRDVAASIAIESSYGAIMKSVHKRQHYKKHLDSIAQEISAQTSTK